MVSDYDFQAIAYGIVVPFALYAVNMDRITPQVLRPVRTPEAPGGVLALLAIAMAIWPGTVESHRPTFVVAICAAVLWLWRVLHVRETRLEAKDTEDLEHRKAPVLSNCDRLHSKIVRLAEDLNLNEGNVLFESDGDESDPEAATDEHALIDTIRRDVRTRYNETIYDDLVGLKREMHPFKVDETELISILDADPSTVRDYELIASKLEGLIQSLDAALVK